MASPADVVADVLAQSLSNASSAKSQLTAFTNALNAAVQLAPVTSITFTPVAGPGAGTVGVYTAPADYTSSLVTTLTTKITDRLAGGTGIATAVETAIWNRARERELATMQANIDAVTRDTESLGFQLPPGVLVDAIRRETRGYYDKTAVLSTETAIKQADLEQVNMQKIIEQGVSFEGVLADIRFKRSQAALDAYRAEIAKFTAEVDQDVKHWEAQIKQYEAEITYTLNAEKLNSEIIRANLGASLDAAKVGAQVYAQLTASAYSMVHASAGVSASAGNNVSYSYSNDTTTTVAPVTAV